MTHPWSPSWTGLRWISEDSLWVVLNEWTETQGPKASSVGDTQRDRETWTRGQIPGILGLALIHLQNEAEQARGGGKHGEIPKEKGISSPADSAEKPGGRGRPQREIEAVCVCVCV